MKPTPKLCTACCAVLCRTVPCCAMERGEPTGHSMPHAAKMRAGGGGGGGVQCHMLPGVPASPST